MFLATAAPSVAAASAFWGPGVISPTANTLPRLVSLADIAGSRAEGLERIDLPVREVERTMWLLIHPDLRGTARVKALMHHLMTGLQKEKDAFMGVQPTVNCE